MYLTYDEYSDAPFFGVLEEGAYTPLEYRARKCIDLATHDRIAGEADVREAVKYTVYDLVTLYSATAAAQAAIAGGIASQSNDGVSTTYGVSGGAAAAAGMAAQEAAILKRYLATETDHNGTPLLYAGVDA